MDVLPSTEGSESREGDKASDSVGWNASVIRPIVIKDGKYDKCETIQEVGKCSQG